MADDFADKFTTPVVHITWWGSYINDLVPSPQPHVQKFLIAWETDVPQTPGTTFSHPGSVIQSRSGDAWHPVAGHIYRDA